MVNIGIQYLYLALLAHDLIHFSITIGLVNDYLLLISFPLFRFVAMERINLLDNILQLP